MSAQAFALDVIAKKIKVIPRSADIEVELAPWLKENGPENWEGVGVELHGNAKFQAKTGEFIIESGDEDSKGGDLARYRFFLTKKGKTKEPLSADPLAYVFVLPGEKFLVLEPIVLIDTKTWVKTDLSKPTGIYPYLKLIRFSSKINKLLVAQFDCAFDCRKDDKTIIWEVTLTPGTEKATATKTAGQMTEKDAKQDMLKEQTRAVQLVEARHISPASYWYNEKQKKILFTYEEGDVLRVSIFGRHGPQYMWVRKSELKDQIVRQQAYREAIRSWNGFLQSTLDSNREYAMNMLHAETGKNFTTAGEWIQWIDANYDFLMWNDKTNRYEVDKVRKEKSADVVGQSLADTEKTAKTRTAEQMTENEAIQMVQNCLLSSERPVQADEMVSAKLEKDSAGRKYWKIEIDTKPPIIPDRARFLSVYDSSDIRYIGFHKSKRFVYKSGVCREVPKP